MLKNLLIIEIYIRANLVEPVGPSEVIFLYWFTLAREFITFGTTL